MIQRRNSQQDDFSSNTSTNEQLKIQDFNHISFFAKQFCIPKEIKLVDHQITIRQGRQIQNNIQIVQRTHLLDNSPLIRDIIDAPMDKQNIGAGDGLISVAKHLGIKVAICITVYTEDKTMLKKTLQGVLKNYEKFYTDAGIHAHQILIIVIFDGLERVNRQKQSDKNMFNLFREFDLINGFRKKQFLLAKKKENQKMNDQQSEMGSIENFADAMVFTQKQYQQLESILFETQFHQYKEMSDLLEFVERDQNKSFTGKIADLPKKIKQTLLNKARLYLAQNGIVDVTDDNIQLQQYIQENLPQEKIQNLKMEAIKEVILVAKDYLRSRQNTAILYQMGLPIEDCQWEQDAKMHLFAVVKHSNRGKLSSHLWFFQGFCQMINPDVAILLDCGLQTSYDAIFKMWAHIHTYKQSCGGVCGYMKLRQENPYDQAGNRPQSNVQSALTTTANYFFDIQKAQIFEYHLSHLMDKPFQSATGYIHVLPGAFSGYNWLALKNQRFKITTSDGKIYQKVDEKLLKKQILKKYLKTVIYNEVLDDIKEANMFLAEDRVLCLEIYTKSQKAYKLQYLPNSQAYVDPITTLPRLLGQRKRWINGSWFALQYVLDNKSRVGDSSHNFFSKLMFFFNMINASISRLVSYTSISLYFVTFHMMVSEFAQTILVNYFKQSYGLTQEQLIYAKIFKNFFSIRSFISSFTAIVDFLFLLALSRIIFLSITLRKQDDNSKRAVNNISTIFGLFGIVFIALIVVNIGQATIWGSQEVRLLKINGTFTQRTFIYLLGLLVGTHTVIVLTAFSLTTYYEILISLPSYFFYTPTYINILLPFAFCRIDDFSWGTKGLDNQLKAQQKKIRNKFADQKLTFAIRWLLINIVVALIFVTLSNDYTIQNYIIWIFSGYFAVVMLIKAIFVLWYHFVYYTCTNIKVRWNIFNSKKIFKGESVLKKNNFAQFVKKVKQQQIQRHIEQINDQIVQKNMMDKFFKLQATKILGLSNLNMVKETANYKDYAGSQIYKPEPEPSEKNNPHLAPQNAKRTQSMINSFQFNDNLKKLGSVTYSVKEQKKQQQKKLSFKDLKRMSMLVQKKDNWQQQQP